MVRNLLVVMLLVALLVGCATAAKPTLLVAEPPDLAVDAQPTLLPSPTSTLIIATPKSGQDAMVANGDEAYPSPVDAELSGPYPGPEPTMDVTPLTAALAQTPAIAKVVVPTPSAGKATVTGRVYYRVDDDTREPLQYARVFLARRLRDAQGQPSFMVSLSKGSAPMTITDGEGAFAFGDVNVEGYALIIELGSQLVLAHDLLADRDVVFMAEADQTFDVGEILVAPR